MFIEELNNYPWEETRERIYSKTAGDVERALSKEMLNVNDFMALISPAGTDYLEPMARLSRKYTQQRFGKTIQFYIPLYLTNSCINRCVYCGFNHDNPGRRIILTDEEISEEINAIKAIGNFQHILLVTGENPRDAGIDYIENAVNLIRPHFSSISIEVQPLKEEEYVRLKKAGVNAVYCYQETYRREHYKLYHPKGLKSDFVRRLDTYERIGKAGIYKMGLGTLIGLEDRQTDAVMMAYHLRYLQKNYRKTKYSISFPRLRPHEGDSFRPNVVTTDKELAQLIFAFRLFDHDVELALSTRENQHFRDNMMSLGITSMSAGSKTDPGGYAVYPQSLEQFSVNDDRSPDEILNVIKDQEYEVVWKDWDWGLDGRE